MLRSPSNSSRSLSAVRFRARPSGFAGAVSRNRLTRARGLEVGAAGEGGAGDAEAEGGKLGAPLQDLRTAR
jgi:hypothetical protein